MQPGLPAHRPAMTRRLQRPGRSRADAPIQGRRVAGAVIDQDGIQAGIAHGLHLIEHRGGVYSRSIDASGGRIASPLVSC